MLGVRSSLQMAAALAQLDDPVDAFEEAAAVGLLQSTDKVDIWDVAFPHPLVQAAVYEHVSPTSRVRLHRAASELVDDAGAALRHRVAATTPPNGEVAAALDAFARREMRWGAWASAASALVEASRMSVERAEREERLLRAIDAIVSAGDLLQASAFTRDVARFEPGPLRDAALGYLAILRGRVAEAEALLTDGLEAGRSRRPTRISPRCWRCGGRCTRWGDCAERTSSSGAGAPWRSCRTTTRSASRPRPSSGSGWGSWVGCRTGWRPTSPCSPR